MYTIQELEGYGRQDNNCHAAVQHVFLKRNPHEYEKISFTVN